MVILHFKPMKYLSALKIILVSVVLVLFSNQSIAQCGSCTATTVNVNLSSATDTSWTYSGVRSGNCCTGTNCIVFMVTLNPGSDLLSFNVTNPSPSGAAYYQINCGPQVSIGTPACVNNQTSVCITYCKPGGDSPTYHITATKTVQASADIQLREGCAGTLSVNGMQTSSITWNSIFPGTSGQYNSYLSCTTGCASTTITPTAGAPSYIDYVVTGNPNTSCPGVSTDTVRVYVSPGITPSISPANPVICAGSSDILLTASASGGTPPFTYLWSTGATTQSITAGVGTYVVSISDSASSCPPVTDTVVVTSQPAVTTPTATNSGPVCEGSSVNLFASTVTGATYSWTGPNGFTSTLQNPVIPAMTSAEAGVYSVVAIINGCSSPAGNTTVTVNPIPAQPVASSNSPVCSGSSINLSTPLVSGATYSWTGPNGFTSTAQNPVITNSTLAATGTYSVTVTVNGCTSNPGTTSVTVDPTPVPPTLGYNSPVCAGSSINLTANNVTGATYNWTGPNGFTSTNQNPVISSAQLVNSGTYNATVTVGGCTSAASSVSVTVNPIPATPVAGSNSPVCEGSPLNLTTSTVTGATYSWTGPNGFSSSVQNPVIPAITSAGGGTYSVTVTVNGCTSSAGTVGVTVQPLPAAPVAGSNSPVCSGNSINLSATTISGATYVWSGPNGFTSTSQNPTISNATTAASGTYTVSAVLNGCPGPSATTTVTVNQTPVAPAASANSPLCVGANLNLTSNSITGATYSWTGPNGFSSASQNPVISNVSTADAGTYSVTATVNGCTGPAGTVAVVVNSPPATPSPTSNSPVCTGDSILLNVPAFAGSTYSWTGPNGFTSTLQNPAIPNVISAAAGTYSVVINNGCNSSPGTVSVVVNPTPVSPTVSSNSPLCAGSTINLSANTVSGASYNWSGPNGFSSTSQNPSIPNATLADSGNYLATVTVGGCTSIPASTNVIVYPIPATPTVSSNSPVCEGGNLNLSTTAVTGATYSWTGPNSFVSSLQNPVITGVTPAATGTYSLTVTVNGCTSPAGSTAVTIQAIPAAPTVSSNSPVCSGNAVNLTASSITGATYSWTGPNGFTSTSQNPVISNATVAASGTYSVSALFNGCPGPGASTTVTVNQTPLAPVASANTPLCVGANLNLAASTITGATYTWTGPNSFSSSSQNPVVSSVTTADAGTYSVTATVNGCTGPAGTVSVVVNSPPATPVPGSNSPVCSGNSVNLTVPTVTGATYSWTGPNGFTSTSQNPVIANSTVAATGTYSVVINNGCNSTPGSVSVVVNQTPAAPVISSNSPVCAGNPINLTSNTVAGATYNWTGPGGFTSSAQNPVISPAALSDAGVYYADITVNSCTGPSDSLTVVVNDTVVVNAGSDVTVCANNSLIALSGQISGGSTTGVWTTSGDGTFSPSATTLNANYIPGVLDTTNGSVTLTLTASSTAACPATQDQMVVTITPAPVVNAGPDQAVCANNSTVSLNGNVSTASGGTWTTSGTGTFSPSASTLNGSYIPGAADTAAGFVTLVLTSTGNGQCLAVQDTVIVTITPAPVVNAGPDQTICLNTPNAGLSGTVSGGTTTGIWTTTGTGTFSPSNTALNATYIPGGADTVAGSVILILTSTNNGGCAAVIDSLVINYTNQPIVSAGPDVTVCANNALITLNGSVTGGGSAGVWTSSGSGVFSPDSVTLNATYTPSAADTANGTVVLTLSSTNGCVVNTDQLTITITPAPQVNAGPDIIVCKNNLNINLNGSVFGGTTTGIWTTSGTGTFQPSSGALNASYVPSNADTAAGSVTLVLTSTNNGNCIAVTDTLQVTITDPPVALAGADVVMCANDSLQLNGTILYGVGTGVWTSNGTGTFIPSASNLNAIYVPGNADTIAGAVTLYLTSTNNGNCIPSVDTMQVTINPAPVVNAGPDQAFCANNPFVSLSGSVTIASGGVWTTLGTGTFSDDSLLTTTYVPGQDDIDSGSVTLILTSTGNGLCNPVRDTVIINVTPSPVVNAGNDIFICTGSTTAQLSGSVSGGSTTGTWTTLGTGTFSSANNLNAVYTLSTADTSAGFVYLVLTSTNNGSCNAVSDTVMIGITPIPYPSAGPDVTVCANNASVNLNGSISGGSGLAQWVSSGDGVFLPSDTTLNATYSPGVQDTAAGGVWIYLTPLNSCNPIPDSLFITINPAPVVDAGANQSVCYGSVFNLNGFVSAPATGGIWTTNGAGQFLPNDSALSVQYVPDPSDTLNSSLYVILTSTGNGLCNPVSDTVNLSLETKPVADFAFGPACDGSPVTFYDSSTVSSGSVVQWDWMIGMTNYSVQNPSHTFTGTGLRNITLIATTTGGCSDTITRSVFVNPVPQANFDASASCSDSVVFNDLSSISQGSITNWSWDFGDSLTGTDQNPVHTYTGSGNYFVTLTVTSDSGCSSTFSDTVSVLLKPDAGFTYEQDCDGEITFMNNSSATVINYQWNFGDGSVSSEMNPEYTYNDAGTYNVTLIVDDGSCMDTILSPVTVQPSPQADFIPKGGSQPVGQDIQFTDQSTGATSWLWSFGSGTDSSTDQNPEYTFDQSGVYSVKLLITASTGCMDSVVYEFNVSGGDAAVPSAFTPNGDGVNDILYVRGGPFVEFDFRVFNEWGNEVFNTVDSSKGWDGTINGKPQSAGTFIYVVKGTATDGSQIELTGDVTLIR